ncbi:MAG: LysR substrate-binding domain-containing protein [Pseudomonadota bacterium]
MTLDQLRIFVTVAEASTMTRAAVSLHLSQPAVSAAVAALEGRHGSRLFDRIGRRLELTHAGRLFLPEAKAVLARAKEALQVLEDLSGLVRGEVRVAASQTVATYWLPPHLARFAVAQPGIILSMIDGNTAQAASAVLAGDADMAVVEGRMDHPLLERRTVGHDRLGLYAAMGHRLGGLAIGKAEMLEAVWTMREPGSGTRDHFAAVLPSHGLTIGDLDIRLELPSNGAVLAAVEGSEMIAPISDVAAAPRRKAQLIQRLDCTLPERNFSLLLHRERHLSRAVRAFLDVLPAAS